jgi:hypothetical protein
LHIVPRRSTAVRNLWDGGARLKVFSPIGIPDTFELRLDSPRSAVAGWFGEKPPKSALSSPDHLARGRDAVFLAGVFELERGEPEALFQELRRGGPRWPH